MQAIILQEVDVFERDVARTSGIVRDAGCHILWSEPSYVSHGNQGRRAAIITKTVAPPITPSRDLDANAQWLRASGRWVEALLPVDGGHLYISSLYGYSGASDTTSPTFRRNEALLAAAVVRAAQYGHLPCFIGCDLNCDPTSSGVAHLARAA